MMNTFVFSKKAVKRFLNLPKSAQTRILTKLESLKEYPDIFPLIKRLHHFEEVSHRLRVGPYRLLLELKIQNKDRTRFLIVDVGDRRDVYR